MTKLLVQGTSILGKEPFVEDGDKISWRRSDMPNSEDGSLQKSVITGTQIVEVNIPDDFDCAANTWNGSSFEKRPEQQLILNAEKILAALDDIDKKSIRALREGDKQRLADLDGKAITLRAKLNALK